MIISSQQLNPILHQLKALPQVIFILLFHIGHNPFLQLFLGYVPIFIGIAVFHCFDDVFSRYFFDGSVQTLGGNMFIHFENSSQEELGLLVVQVLAGFVVDELVPDLVQNVLDDEFIFKFVLELLQELPGLGSPLIWLTDEGSENDFGNVYDIHVLDRCFLATVIDHFIFGIILERFKWSRITLHRLCFIQQRACEIKNVKEI